MTDTMSPFAGGIIGTPRLRKEDPALLTGESKFIDDLPLAAGPDRPGTHSRRQVGAGNGTAAGRPGNWVGVPDPASWPPGVIGGSRLRGVPGRWGRPGRLVHRG